MSLDAFEELLAVTGGVSRETFDRLRAFEAEFGRWATKINLAAPSTLGEVWRRHILDSAQLVRLKPDALSWLDLGSGGGFPGAVLAILLAGRPGASVRLVESNKRKAAFLTNVLGLVGLSVRVEKQRIEDIALLPMPDIVTARALATLPALLGLSARWLGAGAVGLFHKGREFRVELEESRDDWRFDLVEHQSAIDPEGVVLEIGKLRLRDGAAPCGNRRTAQR